MNNFEYVIAMERVRNTKTVKAIRAEVNKAYSILQLLSRKVHSSEEDFNLASIIRAWSYLIASIHMHTGKNHLPKRYYKEAGLVYANISYHLVSHIVSAEILHIFRNPYA